MKPSKKKFFAEIQKNNPKNYNFSVISDLEDDTKKTYDALLDLRSEISSVYDNFFDKLNDLRNTVFDEQLNAYSDINDSLLDVGIKGTDFTTEINSNIENSISEINEIESLLK